LVEQACRAAGCPGDGACRTFKRRSLEVLNLGDDIPLLIDPELALVHKVLDDFRGAQMLLDGVLELGYLHLHLVELLQLLADLDLSLLLV
jgi:hypothetical protein